MGFFDRFKTTTPKSNAKPAKAKQAPKEETKPKLVLKEKVEGEATAGKATKNDKGPKAKKDDTKSAYRILVKPLITEKATDLVTLNKYSFSVARNANKIEVKKAIFALYGVEPVNVNIVVVRGKRTTSGRIAGKRKTWKKAIITLKKGEKIEIYEGV